MGWGAQGCSLLQGTLNRQGTWGVRHPEGSTAPDRGVFPAGNRTVTTVKTAIIVIMQCLCTVVTQWSLSGHSVATRCSRSGQVPVLLWSALLLVCPFAHSAEAGTQPQALRGSNTQGPWRGQFTWRSDTLCVFSCICEMGTSSGSHSASRCARCFWKPAPVHGYCPCPPGSTPTAGPPCGTVS